MDFYISHQEIILFLRAHQIKVSIDKYKNYLEAWNLIVNQPQVKVEFSFFLSCFLARTYAFNVHPDYRPTELLYSGIFEPEKTVAFPQNSDFLLESKEFSSDSEIFSDMALPWDQGDDLRIENPNFPGSRIVTPWMV
jgi:hypothetical protein